MWWQGNEGDFILKIISWILIGLILLAAVMAEMCSDYPRPNVNCSMVTPNIICSTDYNYSIMNSTGSVIETRGMGVWSGTQYYFNFTKPRGTYMIELCNNATREVFVGIGVDVNMYEFSVVFIMAIFFTVLFFLGKTWDFTLFTRKDKEGSKQNIIKAFFVLMGMWLMLGLLQFAIRLGEINSADSTLITLLTSLYTADLWINYVVTAYMFIFFMFNIAMYLGVDIVAVFKGKAR